MRRERGGEISFIKDLQRRGESVPPHEER